MNILITLPKHLLDKLLSGEKKYEMRKCLQKKMKIGEDGFSLLRKELIMLGVGVGYIDSFEISIYSHASTIIVPNEIAHSTDYTKAAESALKYSLENLI